MSVTKGDIVQLNPDSVRNKAFAGCFMTITQVHKGWVVGYVQCLGETFVKEGGAAYYRAALLEFEGPVGRAIWVKS